MKVIADSVAITEQRKGVTSIWLRAPNPQDSESHACGGGAVLQGNDARRPTLAFPGRDWPSLPCDLLSCASAERTAMAREFTPTERRARVICKLLWRDRTLTLEALRALSRQDQSRSGARHQRLRRANGDFDQAVAIGIEMGWLLQTADGPQLTKVGMDIAKRTRAGGHRSRLDDVSLDNG